MSFTCSHSQEENQSTGIKLPSALKPVLKINVLLLVDLNDEL